MKMNFRSAIAAASAATVVVFISAFLSSCEGRKMSNMVPTGDTVEVNISHEGSYPTEAGDSLPADTISDPEAEN